MKIFLMMMVLGLASACGKTSIGGSCDDVGKASECEDGAICSNDSGGNYCRKSCSSQADCASGESCNGISGTDAKSCQPG